MTLFSFKSSKVFYNIFFIFKKNVATFRCRKRPELRKLYLLRCAHMYRGTKKKEIVMTITLSILRHNH